MAKSLTPALDMVVTHLNASVGSVLTRDELSSALRAGRLAAIHRQPAASLVCYLFAELDPALIARCVGEAQSSLQSAYELYQDTLLAKAPRSLSWERSVGHLL